MKWSSLLFCFIPLVLTACSIRGRASELTFVCSEENDLYGALSTSGHVFPRYGTPFVGINEAPPGTAVLILADGYPDALTRIAPDDYARARDKNLRLYVEYPEQVPGVELQPVRETAWERVVVSSTAFGEQLPLDTILYLPGCRLRPFHSEKPLLSVARVAGYDRAVYGLPEENFPLLAEVPELNCIVATSKLSDFRAGRHMPAESWKIVWRTLLERLGAPDAAATLEWVAVVRPAYGREDRLPSDYELQALARNVEWIYNSKLLLHSEQREEVHKRLMEGGEFDPRTSYGTGDGSLGILEGYSSSILSDGGQQIRIPLRADCQMETAMILALHSKINGTERDAETARNLMRYLFETSGMCKGDRGTPDHGAYGLIAWGDVAPAWMVGNYGDDNARALLGAILTSTSLQDPEWDLPILRAIAANYRTTGPLGFRGERVDMPALSEFGWEHFAKAETIHYSPHFEAGLWACYLWAYRQTEYEPFLDKARSGIRMTMEAFPDGWRWDDNLERARMLLCNAWLVQVDDTGLHREWLELMARELLKNQDESGAIRELPGRSRSAHFRVPQSNEEYGTHETPLQQFASDPVSDQLYTTGFALLGLHEAHAATGDPLYLEMEDRLAEYLCRIQTKSEQFPEFNGAWYRAFDYKKWDYWASAADAGWGPWCLEAGWGGAWTAAVLALREMDTSVWTLTASSKAGNQWDAVRKEMELEP